VRILRGSDHVVVALDGTRVVGFVTALSDAVLYAYVSLLEVLPEYRRRSIGSELMRRMLARLAHLYGVDLLCDAGVQSFFAGLGLRPEGGMPWRNFAWKPSGPSLTTAPAKVVAKPCD
jgi:GNAT superfamily N-acetyltransferase